jgi:hypothetical protein
MVSEVGYLLKQRLIQEYYESGKEDFKVNSFKTTYADLFFLNIVLIFNNGGMVSPNKNPQGFKGSI